MFLQAALIDLESSSLPLFKHSCVCVCVCLCIRPLSVSAFNQFTDESPELRISHVHWSTLNPFNLGPQAPSTHTREGKGEVGGQGGTHRTQVTSHEGDCFLLLKPGYLTNRTHTRARVESVKWVIALASLRNGDSPIHSTEEQQTQHKQSGCERSLISNCRHHRVKRTG